ncbi:endonuclease I [Kipferlia bialata]|uniref:Endonuclease I n=1 Tax=Kipferlia bialata TaxID=797122 RepID=A0A9K3CTK3_9EUKA|nr:endonuclease I [Kipferlia bialata]|eukprot:g3215.t1
MRLLLGVLAVLAGCLCIYDDLSGAELRSKLYRDTYWRHHETLGYSDARAYMYGAIDNLDDAVYGIYTDLRMPYAYNNYTMSVDTQTEAETEAEREVEPTEPLTGGSINCEHIVPQSFFNKKDPMVSDVHHLRPAESRANSARNHFPFEQIADEDVKQWFYQDVISTAIPPESDIANWSRLRDSQDAWEPRDEARGTIARAVLYFYTMYSQFLDEMDRIGDVNMFIQWNNDHPPSQWDMDRNDRAEFYQGNRNPYVDNPELCERAFEDMI